MADPIIGVTLDRHQVHLGEAVRAVLAWQADAQPAAVRIELRWVTEGRGDVNSGVVAQHRHGPELGPIPGQLEAALVVPPHAPVSYDGHLIRVRWEVRGVLELRWRIDPSGAAPLQVLPLTISQ